MAKRQNFVVGSTNPVTATKTQAELNNGWNKYQVLKAGDLDGVFNAVSDYSNDSSNEIANAIQALTGAQPTGQNQSELAGALNQMRQDIETSSLTFKGYVATSAPSSSTYGLAEGNIWINASAMPTTFPVAIAGVWNGTSWESTTDTYTVKDFDFFRNINNNEGYYWFGGQWVVMSTDMSTTYFTLNQTSGKWEIKSSVNLPGSPTTTTPTSSSPDNQIATKKYVDEAIAPLPTTTYFPDVFDQKWSDYILSNPRWLRADDFAWHNRAEGPVAYQHLADDYNALVTSKQRLNVPGHTLFRNESLDVLGEAHPYAYSTEDQTTFVAYTDVLAEPGVSLSAYDGPTSSASSMVANPVGPWSMAFYNNETIAGTTIIYYLAADGHKICLPDQESNVSAIYTATGMAWYYILDTVNQRFKLPRGKHNKYTETLGVVGNGLVLGLTNGTDTAGTTFNSNTTSINPNRDSYGLAVSSSGTQTENGLSGRIGVTPDSAKSGLVTTSMAQETDQYKYLYFYNGSNT